MNKEAEWAKTAPYCELHRPTRRYTHSNRNIVLRLLKSFRKTHISRVQVPKVQYLSHSKPVYIITKFNTAFNDNVKI
jgi:hypothetical protein